MPPLFSVYVLQNNNKKKKNAAALLLPFSQLQLSIILLLLFSCVCYIVLCQRERRKEGEKKTKTRTVCLRVSLLAGMCKVTQSERKGAAVFSSFFFFQLFYISQHVDENLSRKKFLFDTQTKRGGKKSQEACSLPFLKPQPCRS